MKRRFKLRDQNTKTNPTSSQPTRSDLEQILTGIEDLADDALDPELSREELVAKVKEIYDLAGGEDQSHDEDDD